MHGAGRPSRFARRFALLAVLLGLAACARAVSIGTGAGPVYRVMVQNTLAEDMIVSYDDGGGAAVLGTVRANGSQPFNITAPRTTNVSITAANAARTRTVGPLAVRLQIDSTPTVVIR